MSAPKSEPTLRDLTYKVVANERHSVRVATWRNGRNQWCFSITLDGQEIDRGHLTPPVP